MKKLLLLTITLATAALSYSQCTPMTDFGDQPFGVAPDTVVNFVPGSVNNIYSQQIDVKVPLDGSFVGFPVGVDSATVLSISGLPEGLTLACAGNAATECTYLSGTEGCAVISGIPTVAGTYELVINLLVYTAFGTNVPFSFDGYRIVVDGTTGLEDVNFEAIKTEDIRPNPANTSATLFLDSKSSGEAQFRVFDLVGKEVFTKDYRITQGKNKITYNTSQLPEGVYIYRLDAFGESITSRLVVVH